MRRPYAQHRCQGPHFDPHHLLTPQSRQSLARISGMSVP